MGTKLTYKHRNDNGITEEEKRRKKLKRNVLPSTLGISP
jgi:hypothetical protein